MPNLYKYLTRLSHDILNCWHKKTFILPILYDFISNGSGAISLPGGKSGCCHSHPGYWQWRFLRFLLLPDWTSKRKYLWCRYPKFLCPRLLLQDILCLIKDTRFNYTIPGLVIYTISTVVEGETEQCSVIIPVLGSIPNIDVVSSIL